MRGGGEVRTTGYFSVHYFRRGIRPFLAASDTESAVLATSPTKVARPWSLVAVLAAISKTGKLSLSDIWQR